MLKAIFTWWNGATIGAGFHINRRGLLGGQADYRKPYLQALARPAPPRREVRVGRSGAIDERGAARCRAAGGLGPR